MFHSQRKTTKHSISLLLVFVSIATLFVSAASACDDVPPGPEHTCQQQAEWKKCDEPWMKDKCKKSCGRCGGGGAPANPAAPVLESGAGKSGKTTRYWDCSKPSCGWPDKAMGKVTSPVKACAQNGRKKVSESVESVHMGGGAYMCTDQQPRAVNENLSYGFAAAKIAGQGEAEWCCVCYELEFTSDPLKGKKMIVQVTNTGGDLDQDHFDIQIPGGGVGLNDGCTKQFGRTWGEKDGGIKEKSECNQLPKALQRGCNWRFDWFKNADNPTINYKVVTCPTELTKKTQCQRK